MNTFNGEELTKEIREYLYDILSSSERAPQFGDNESLLISGRLHSLGVIELISRLEQKYHLDLTRQGFNQYDFDSVESIVELIERKAGEG